MWRPRPRRVKVVLRKGKKRPARNWLELPREVTAEILRRLGVVDRLTSAQYVCATWREICREPSMWRHVDMFMPKDLDDPLDYVRLCRLAVELSQGSLVSLRMEYFADDDLLLYISERSSQLKHLGFASCYDISEESLALLAAKVPLLEELEFYFGNASEETIAVFGRCCPLLKKLKKNCQGVISGDRRTDEEALAIAEYMPGLVHLQIFGNLLTNAGLEAILDSCCHLQSLDLRQCFNLNLFWQLGKTCAERIKDLRLPNDPTDDYPFDSRIAYSDDSDSDQLLDYDDNDVPILEHQVGLNELANRVRGLELRIQELATTLAANWAQQHEHNANMALRMEEFFSSQEAHWQRLYEEQARRAVFDQAQWDWMRSHFSPPPPPSPSD